MKRKRPSSSGDEEAKRFLFDKIKVEDIDIPYEHTDIQSQKPDDEVGRTLQNPTLFRDWRSLLTSNRMAALKGIRMTTGYEPGIYKSTNAPVVKTSFEPKIASGGISS